jgi:glycosyltransferase involved in cell wall biosynthesis
MTSPPPLRPPLAWHSPLPPEPGGVSAYSVSLLENLRGLFDIALVPVPAGLRPVLGPELADCAVLAPGDGADPAARLNVYHMGNNERQSGATFEALAREPGLTVVHDLNIHGFLLDHLARTPAKAARGRPLARLARSLKRSRGDGAVEDHPYWRALSLAHADAGAAAAEAFLRFGALPDIAALPCHPLLSAASRALVVHSQWAARALRENGHRAPVHVLPLGIEAARALPAGARENLRRQAGAGDDGFVVVCAGYLEPSRRLDKVIAALAQLPARGTNALLVLAGAMSPAHRRFLEGETAARGVADRVRFLGFVDDAQFHGWMAAADAVVHLRHPTNGETSATVLRALAAGAPVVVSDADAYRELPDACCWKVDPGPAEAELLAEYLATLAARPEVRGAMSAEGRRHTATGHAWPEVARRFAEIVMETMDTPGPRPQPLAGRIFSCAAR